MAHPGGRPREYDRIQVGKDFVEWAKTHPDCLTVPHFTTSNGYNTFNLIKWCDEDPEFHQYYMEAKEYIGINRLNATRITEEKEKEIGQKPLDKTIYLRHVGNFDPDKRKFDREEKEFDSKLKKEEAKEQAAINAENIAKISHFANSLPAIKE